MRFLRGQTPQQRCIGRESRGQENKNEFRFDLHSDMRRDRKHGSTSRSSTASLTMHDVWMYYCQACKSFWGINELSERRTQSRAAANVARRMGVAWRCSTRGFLYKAGEDTKRARKHVERARRNGDASIMDSYAKDKRCTDCMDLNGVSGETMQAWGALYEKRERSPLLARRAFPTTGGSVYACLMGLSINTCCWTRHNAVSLELRGAEL